jgi:hypothetical protein
VADPTRPPAHLDLVFSSKCVGWLVLSGALALCAWPDDARALAPRRFALNLVREEGAESCVSSPRMAALVQRHMGPVLVATADAEFSIEVRLSAVLGAGWEARVVISDASGAVFGRRQLTTREDTCHALDLQLLLVIALAIDPEFGERGLPPQLLDEFQEERDADSDLLATVPEQSAGEEVQEPQTAGDQTASDQPASPASVAHVPAKAPHAPDTRWSWRTRGALALGMGLLPKLAVGPSLSLQARPPGFWPLELEGVFWFENNAEIEAPGERTERVGFEMAQVSVSICPIELGTGPLAIQACAGVFVGLRWVDANDLDRASAGLSRSALGPFLAGRLSHEVTDSIGLIFDLQAQIPLGRDTFTYQDLDDQPQQLFRPAAVGLISRIGVELRL